MDKIKVIFNNQNFIVKDIPDGNTVLFLGRHSECDIILPGNGISRKHARILSANGQVFVEDLNSTAGTILNGNRIDTMMPLASGDVVQIADYKIVLTDENDRENQSIPQVQPAPPQPVPVPQPEKAPAVQAAQSNDFKKEFADATVLYEPEIMTLTRSIHEDILEKLNKIAL